MKLNPIEWASKLMTFHGHADALRIANENRRPFIGKNNDTVNVDASWYERAYRWLQKHPPAI